MLLTHIWHQLKIKDFNLIWDSLQLLNLNCGSDLNDDQFWATLFWTIFWKLYHEKTFLYSFRYLHNHLHKFHMDPEINDFTLGPNNNPAEFRLRSKLETDVLTCEFCGFSSKTRANHNVHLSTCKQKNIISVSRFKKIWEMAPWKLLPVMF